MYENLFLTSVKRAVLVASVRKCCLMMDDYYKWIKKTMKYSLWKLLMRCTSCPLVHLSLMSLNVQHLQYNYSLSFLHNISFGYRVVLVLDIFLYLMEVWVENIRFIMVSCVSGRLGPLLERWTAAAPSDSRVYT